MAKERAVEKDKSRKREKKVSDDKVTKTKKQKKKRAATPSDASSDDESTGGVSVNAEAPDDTPMVDPAATEETGPRSSKTAKNEKKAKKPKGGVETHEGTDADADTANGGAMLFAIDTKPTLVDLASIPTVVATEHSDDKDVKKKKPKKKQPPSGRNRAERRRIKMIEKQREVIRQKMGIPEGSSERADEVQKQLDKWTEALDAKNAIRLEKKRARKDKEAARLRKKHTKVLTGRKPKDVKQISKSGK